MRTIFRLALALPLCSVAYPQAGTLAGVSVGMNGSLNGWRPPSPYSVDVSGMAVDPHISSGWVSDNGAFHIHIDWAGSLYYGSGIPINVVDSSTGTPKFSPVPVPNAPYGVSWEGYGSNSDLVNWPIPLAYIQEGGVTDSYGGQSVGDCYPPAGQTTHHFGDAHLLILDKGTGAINEAYSFSRCNGQFIAAATTIFDVRKSTQQRPLGFTSSDGGGFSLFAGLAKYDETTTNVVHDHLADGTALDTMGHGSRFTMQNIRCSGYVNGDGVNGFFLPASHAACDSGGGWNIYGIRIRLKESYDTSGLTGSALILTNSWKKYGLILADGGSNGYVSGTMDSRWDTNNLLTLQAIPLSAFDVVTAGTEYLPASSIPSSGLPTGVTVALLPTGSNPTNTTPTFSSATIIQGQTVNVSYTSNHPDATGYDYIQNGLPGASAASGPNSATITHTPVNTTTYATVSCNQFGCTTSTPATVTVLVPPYVGVAAVGFR